MPDGTVRFSGGTGADREQAVVIEGATSSMEGAHLERIWLTDHFGRPGTDWRIEEQSVITAEGRPYDLIRLRLANGSQREVWFDIGGFYGVTNWIAAEPTTSEDATQHEQERSETRIDLNERGSVQIESGPGAGQRYPLTPGGITIGRQADNTIVVDDPQISRHHTRIEQRAGVTLVSDLDTANGTYLNGQRIVGGAPLHNGDILRVGTVTLRYIIMGAQPQTPTKRRIRLPVLISIVGLCIAVCCCGTASLAIIVGNRNGTPTVVIASEPTMSVPSGNTIATVPTLTATTANVAKSAPTTAPAVFSTATATPRQAIAAVTLSTATLAPRPTSAPIIVSTATTAPKPTMVPLKPTATTPSIAPTRPPVAGTAGGTYRGTVKRGYTITFRISPDGKQISAVEARVLTSCGTGRSTDTVFAPEVSFPVAADGRFSGVGEYQPGFRYEFSGQLRGTSATGYLRDSSVVIGAVCDTQQLEWTAERQP